MDSEVIVALVNRVCESDGANEERRLLQNMLLKCDMDSTQWLWNDLMPVEECVFSLLFSL